MNFYTNSKVAILVACSVIVASGTTLDNGEPVHVLVYETFADGAEASILKQQVDGRINGIDVELFGNGNEFQGYGDKFISVLPILKNMQQETLVVISDSRDVVINKKHNDDTYRNIFADELKMTFDELTYNHPGAIVVSAEAQCCVTALTHASPGSYFHTDGSRNQTACSSGKPGCLWNGDDKAAPWELFMKELMLDRTARDMHVYDDMYLNAGLIAGRAKDLVRVIESIQIEKNEDDQAVLTDYLYHHPETMVLDYQQKMFGNNRAGVISLSMDDRCTFTMTSEEEHRLRHSKTGTTPFFIHSPGGFYECHDLLSKTLGVPAPVKTQRNLWAETKKCNYGNALQNALCEEREKAEVPTGAPISSLMGLLGK